jgi:hypothetical protein
LAATDSGASWHLKVEGFFFPFHLKMFFNIICDILMQSFFLAQHREALECFLFKYKLRFHFCCS